MSELTLQPRRAPQTLRTIVAALALVVLILAAYAPAFRAGYIWDDENYLLNNPDLRSATGLARIWLDRPTTTQYYPLTLTTFWLEHRLWGTSPTGYHTVNILFHAATTLLLWRFLAHLRIPGALLAAAVWGAHPVMVESVAWITERKNVLSAFFMLLAAHAWLRTVPDLINTPAGLPQKSHTRLWYLALLLAFLAALLSKTVTATFPAAALVILWWKHQLNRRHVLPLLPLLLIGALAGTYTGWLERNVIGAAGSDWDFSLAQRFQIAGRAVWFYAAKLVWPADLSFIYPRWNLAAFDASAWLFPIAAAALPLTLALLARNRPTLRGPLAGTLLFGGMLFPALGFVNIYPMRYSFVADHFQYHAAIPAIVTLVAALVTIETAVRRFNADIPRSIDIPIAPLLPLFLAFLTFRQCHDYRDWLTVFAATHQRNPDSWMVQVNYAHGLRLAAERAQRRAGPPYESAQKLFAQSIHLYNLAAAQRPNDGDILLSLAATLAASGDIDSARAACELARGKTAIPGRADYQLGLLAQRESNRAAAESHYRAAIAQSPKSVEPRVNLAALLAQDPPDPTQTESAESLLRAVIADFPDSTLALNALGDLLARQGRLADAESTLRQSLDQNPTDPQTRHALATTLARLGDYREAELQLLRAIELTNNDPAAQPPLWTDLAILHLLRNNLPAAKEAARRALDLDPNFAPAQQALKRANGL